MCSLQLRGYVVDAELIIGSGFTLLATIRGRSTAERSRVLRMSQEGVTIGCWRTAAMEAIGQWQVLSSLQLL
jgi:hypothetical protein